ncbi:putative malate dehydrogenase, partial [Lentinula novae-zelandiae]
SGCTVSTAIVPNQGGELLHPTYNVTQIGLGIGTQNYSCSSTGNYTSVGAVAELYDVSCEYFTAAFSNVSAEAYRLWAAAPTYYTESTLIDVLYAYRGTPSVPSILGQHYFVPNPTGSGLSPKWDFTSESFAGNNAAYVIGRTVGDIPSPDGSTNIDWLYLINVQGGLAQEVYRTNTTGGQPPAGCTPGSTVAVKYTSLYCEF